MQFTSRPEVLGVFFRVNGTQRFNYIALQIKPFMTRKFPIRIGAVRHFLFMEQIFLWLMVIGLCKDYGTLIRLLHSSYSPCFGVPFWYPTQVFQSELVADGPVNSSRRFRLMVNCVTATFK